MTDQTPLTQLLKSQIQATGPMTVPEFMTLALQHPEHGYYRKQEAIGAAADFVTAPEISQVFGELIGLWLVQRWIDLGQPSRVLLVEFGPGKGTLMADALRAASASASDSIIPARISWLNGISAINATMPNSPARPAPANPSNRPRSLKATNQARMLAAHRTTAMIRQPSSPHSALVHASTGVRTVTKGLVGMAKGLRQSGC